MALEKKDILAIAKAVKAELETDTSKDDQKIVRIIRRGVNDFQSLKTTQEKLSAIFTMAGIAAIATIKDPSYKGALVKYLEGKIRSVSRPES